MKMNLKEKTVTMNHWKRSVLPVAISSKQDLPIVNCIGKYNKFGPALNCRWRACIESLRTYEKFKISEWKVNFYKGLDL